MNMWLTLRQIEKIKFGLSLLVLGLVVPGGTSVGQGVGGDLHTNLFERGEATYINVDAGEDEVVHTALDMLRGDVQAVLNAQLLLSDSQGRSRIIAGTRLFYDATGYHPPLARCPIPRNFS